MIRWSVVIIAPRTGSYLSREWNHYHGDGQRQQDRLTSICHRTGRPLLAAAVDGADTSPRCDDNVQLLPAFPAMKRAVVVFVENLSSSAYLVRTYGLSPP